MNIWIKWLFSFFVFNSSVNNMKEKILFDHNKYKLLEPKIRNFEILTNEELEFIHTLPREKLIYIIKIFSLHVRAIKPILETL